MFSEHHQTNNRHQLHTDTDYHHNNTGVGFLQTDICSPVADLVPSHDSSTVNLECYYCHEKGHTSNNCPWIPAHCIHNPRSSGGGSGRGRGASMMQVCFGFTQLDDNALIPPSWLLLDTCSTSSVSNNKDNVGTIRDCSQDECLKMFTNGGSTFYDKIAPLNLLLFDVHFNDQSMDTILSVKDVANLDSVHITMDTSKEKAMLVHHQSKVLKFRECDDGLYYYDTAEHNHNNVELTNYSFLETVADNSNFFSTDEIKGALRAHQTQQEMNWPSTSDFKYYVSNNCIRISPATIDDINRVDIIYGPAKVDLIVFANY
jgi:hypothetical protein